MTTAPDSRALLRPIVSGLFICAFAGLVLTAVFGFEEANGNLLLLSASLLLTAILVVFVHLGVTAALSGPQRRLWLMRLTGRGAIWAFGEYLTCDDLRATATTFAVDSATSH